MKKRTENSETGSPAKPAVELPPATQTIREKSTPSVAPEPVSVGDPLEPNRAATEVADGGPCREAMTLADHEAVIARALPHQEVVAFALLEINERGLYRPEYRSFKDYLLRRWQLCRVRGDQLLKFARLKRMSTTVGTNAPENERQARAQDARAQGRRGREQDLVMRAMNYVANAYDRLADPRHREFIESLQGLLSEMEQHLDRTGRPVAPAPVGRSRPGTGGWEARQPLQPGGAGS